MTVTGQLGKISTTADGSVRLQIDVRYEDAKDIMQWLYQQVEVRMIEGVKDEKVS